MDKVDKGMPLFLPSSFFKERSELYFLPLKAKGKSEKF